MINKTEYTPYNPSFGGDVADFLGTVKQIETQTPYLDSMNPNGNPYDGITNVSDLVQSFSSTYGSTDNLNILNKSLDSFYGVKEGQELPEVYEQTKNLINNKILELEQK
jgi:hypothetical protein